ncbi:MAG: CoA-binding protein [Desulfobacteraceae bacterium]|nr:MAG: CoA-binding protein [Desulfobacteraceae bacterium]
MKYFMEPQSVAIIGISRRSGPGSYNLMENMINFGFQGKLFPINPHAEEILGIKAYPNVKKVGQNIDLAIISLPRDLVVKSVTECVEAGVKAIIVVTQGFADADARGKELQSEIVALARDNGARILGPNTLGVVNNFNNFTTSFMPMTQDKASVGVICQSGVFFVGSTIFSGPIGKGIDLGNACDIGFYEALEYLGDDPDIKVIAIHMEGLEQPRKFGSLAARLAKEKPLIVFKTGQSETGAKAAASHSGTMAGHYQICKAGLKQAGLHLLDEDGQMKDAVKTLLHQPPMKGNRIAVITPSGAGGIIASDALEKYGLTMAFLSEKTISTIGELSPEWMPLGNPLDIWPAAMRHGLKNVYAEALKAVLDDENVDGVLCISIGPYLPDFDFLDVSESVNEVVLRERQKPVVAWLYGPNPKEISKRFEKEKKIMVYQTIEKAAWALALLQERQEFLDRAN